MKRRDIFALGAGGVVVASLPAAATQAQAGLPAESWPVGEFLVLRDGHSLRVEHKSAPGRVLWETADDERGFLIGEIATMRVKDFGTPEGSFEIADHVQAAYAAATIETVSPSAGGLAVVGTLADQKGNRIGYTLSFAAASATQLGFTATASLPQINRIILRLASGADEAIFGFGMPPPAIGPGSKHGSAVPACSCAKEAKPDPASGRRLKKRDCWFDADLYCPKLNADIS